jgi:hypothetical protein
MGASKGGLGGPLGWELAASEGRRLMTPLRS